MTKLQKVWRCQDGEVVIISNDLDTAMQDFDCNCKVDDGYFITAEQLREVAEHIAWLAFEAQNKSPRDGTNVIETFRKILKERNLFDELGVEDE